MNRTPANPRGKKRLVPRPKGLSPHWQREWPPDDGWWGWGGLKSSWYCTTKGCRYTRKGQPSGNYRCPKHRTTLRYGGVKGLVWVKP